MPQVCKRLAKDDLSALEAWVAAGQGNPVTVLLGRAFLDRSADCAALSVVCANPECEASEQGKAFKRCSRCLGVNIVYCGQRCQKAHWKLHKRECVPAHGPKPSSKDRHAAALLSAAIKPCLPNIHLGLLREDAGTPLEGRVLYVNSNFSPSRVGLLTIPEIRLRLDAAAAAHAQGHAQVAQMARTLGVGITEAKQLQWQGVHVQLRAYAAACQPPGAADAGQHLAQQKFLPAITRTMWGMEWADKGLLITSLAAEVARVRALGPAARSDHMRSRYTTLDLPLAMARTRPGQAELRSGHESWHDRARILSILSSGLLAVSDPVPDSTQCEHRLGTVSSTTNRRVRAGMA